MNIPKCIAATSINSGASGLLGLSLLTLGLWGLFPAPAQAAIPIQHWVQPSGARIYLVESPAIAMVDVQIDFDAGSRRDPVVKAGLASIMSAMLDKGVLARPDAPALNENQLSEAWADLGAQFGAGAGPDSLGFSLRSLTEPDLLAKAVTLAAREMAEPAFPNAVWQREQQRLVAALKESDTRPGSVVSRAYTQAVYGKHPYGFQLTQATLAAITTADMREAHAAGVVACRARISLVGAVNRAQADAIASQLLARLPQQNCA
ncbi:MAG: insulinase family protein, partial [Polaromonas sp.]|nr:insulinase family protein [Polaromonas sp.]